MLSVQLPRKSLCECSPKDQLRRLTSLGVFPHSSVRVVCLPVALDLALVDTDSSRLADPPFELPISIDVDDPLVLALAIARVRVRLRFCMGISCRCRADQER